jgi:hypothetical protein
MTIEQKEAKLMCQLLIKSKAYNEAIKADKSLSELKKIRLQIKKLTQQLDRVMAEKGS